MDYIFYVHAYNSIDCKDGLLYIAPSFDARCCDDARFQYCFEMLNRLAGFNKKETAALIMRFNSIAKICTASFDELTSIKGISEHKAQVLFSVARNDFGSSHS